MMMSCVCMTLGACSSYSAVSVPSTRLKPLDIEFMKRLHDKVNVIPLIAKADTLTPEECQLFKKQVFVFVLCVHTRVDGLQQLLQLVLLQCRDSAWKNSKDG